MYRSAYLVGNVFLVIVWLFIFFKRKDLRKQQLFVSVFSGAFAPIADYFMFYKDYWRPEYILNVNINGVILGIESSLCGFLIGGIASVLYESFFRRRQSFSKPRHVLILVILSMCAFMPILLNQLGINSVWASIISFVVASSTMVIIDKDLIKDAFWSGILFLIIMIIIYSLWFFIYPEALQKFWLIDNLSGMTIWRIPIEELLWFFSAGISLGILYEFWGNVKKYPNIRK